MRCELLILLKGSQIDQMKYWTEHKLFIMHKADIIIFSTDELILSVIAS